MPTQIFQEWASQQGFDFGVSQYNAEDEYISAWNRMLTNTNVGNIPESEYAIEALRNIEAGRTTK